MIQAPLQLSDYWVESISVKASQTYDAERPPDLDLDSISVDSSVHQVLPEDAPPEEDPSFGTLWVVKLRIEQAFIEGKNIPYAFAIEMTGLVFAHPALEGEKLERNVQVNAPSMLFGVAREIIRAATGRGRFAPVIIPSTNFLARLPKKPEPVTSPPAEAEVPVKIPEKKPQKARSRKPRKESP